MFKHTKKCVPTKREKITNCFVNIHFCKHTFKVINSFLVKKNDRIYVDCWRKKY